MDPTTLQSIGVILIITGTIIIIAAFVLLFLPTAKGKARIKGGGAIIIGPVPIIFGTDKQSLKIVLLLSFVLTILLIVFMLLGYLT